MNFWSNESIGSPFKAYRPQVDSHGNHGITVGTCGKEGDHMTVLAVQVHGTPNPNAAKFVLDRSVLGDDGRTFFDVESAEHDPLAARLFRIAGVRALFMVDNFITVTKADEASWDDMVDSIRTSIQEELGG
jgi:hypothetical protein